MDQFVPIIVVNIDNNPSSPQPEIECLEKTINLDQCISDEFPIIDISVHKGIATCKIGAPHNGYTLVTSTKKNKLDGEANIYTPDNIRIATFIFEKEEANGECTFYYRSGKPLFRGYLQNGYRDGYGVEYNEEGQIEFDGFFTDGTRNPLITRSADNSNLWYERDQSGNLISICHKDENGLNHGVCYFYDQGKLSYISRWEHDVEIETTHRFRGDRLTTYKNGKITFRGKYVMKSEFEYIPIADIRVDDNNYFKLSARRNKTTNYSTNERDSCCCNIAIVSGVLLIIEYIIDSIFPVTESEDGIYWILLVLVTFTVFVISCSCNLR